MTLWSVCMTIYWHGQNWSNCLCISTHCKFCWKRLDDCWWIIMCNNTSASLQSKLNMEKQVNTCIKRSCFAQLREINHIRKYLTTDGTKSLVNSRVTSRLDYCTVLLFGVPKAVRNKLHNVRLVTRASRYNHRTLILKQLRLASRKAQD